MKIRTTSLFPASGDIVWELLQKSSTLFFITKNWITFGDREHFPERWHNHTVIYTTVRPFAQSSNKPYKIIFITIDNNKLIMKTRESGAGIKTWNHTMRVQSVSIDRCYYIDEVEAKAGILTPLLWLYIKLYYKHRHKRWMELLAQQT